jgi:hypothetical protein
VLERSRIDLASNQVNRLQTARRQSRNQEWSGSVPADPLSDVLPWHYSGNHNHPTEKAVDTIKPIIEAFTKAGDVVLDPFSGSGSSLVAAALLGRQYIGIELEQKYCDHARRRLAGVIRHLAIPRREPQREGGIRRAGAFHGSSSDLYGETRLNPGRRASLTGAHNRHYGLATSASQDIFQTKPLQKPLQCRKTI